MVAIIFVDVVRQMVYFDRYKVNAMDDNDVGYNEADSKSKGLFVQETNIYKKAIED